MTQDPPGTVIVRAAAQPLDEPLDGRTVLVPSRRAARAIGVPYRTLAARAAADLARSGRTLASPLRRWRALGIATREVVGTGASGAWRRALAEPVAALLAADLAHHREPPGGLSPGAQRAWRVAAHYRNLLGERDEVDPSALFDAAATVGRAQEAPWLVSGVADLAGAAGRYLIAVAPPGSVAILPPEADRSVRHLTQAGWTVRRDPGQPMAESAAAYHFATVDEETRWFLARVCELLQAGVDPAQILLVVADPAAAAYRLEAIGWELGVSLRIDRQLPLRATAVGGWIARCAEAIARDLPYETTLQVLHHRLVGAGNDEAWRQARARHPIGAVGWSGIDPRATLLDWPPEASRGVFLERFRSVLSGFELPREGLEPYESATIGLVLRGLLEAGLPSDEVVPRRAFLSDVEDLLALLKVRPPPSGTGAGGGVALGPVDVVAPAAAAAGRVAHLFVLGLNEGVLPADVRDAPMLDFADRALLARQGAALPAAAEQARDAWREFASALRSGRDEVIFGVPARGGGNALLPSPYLARLDLAPVTAPARPPASPEERRRAHLRDESYTDPAGDPVLASARHAWHTERRRESAAPPDAFDGVTGSELDPAIWNFSATSLQDLGRCPFRWFVRYRLGLESFEESDERITPLLRGRLWHAALEIAVTRTLDGLGGPGAAQWREVDDATVRSAISARLEQAFAEAERAAQVPNVDGEAWRRVRGGEIRALQRLVLAEDFLSPGMRPLDVERRFSGGWRGLRVHGYVDRVDADEDGVELIDYKSGTTKPKGALSEDRQSWIDVQLPLYLEVDAPELADLPPRQRARYLSVRSAQTLTAVEPGAADAELSGLVGRVERHLSEGSYPLAPDERREVCRTCEYGPVCRVGPRVERKRDAGAVEVGAEGTG